MLLPSRGRAGYRVQKSSYGPLNPIRRPDDGDRASWGRWDVPRHRTIYAATSRVGAYLETMGWADLEGPAVRDVRLDDLFDDLVGDVADTPWWKEISNEWSALGHLSAGKLPQQWRDERTLYSLELPNTGWFVQIDHSAGIAALKEMTRARLGGAADGPTLEHLLDSNRDITTWVADFIHSLVLEDQSQPRGIIYPSKHGTDHQCYAIWLRETDRGEVAAEPTRSISGHSLELTDTDLRRAAHLLGVDLY